MNWSQARNWTCEAEGYTAGVGMSIGTAFGRIAGTQAAAAALGVQRAAA